ncbi:hypothetical protein [Cupriavidus basilensis]|uniref:hypothetical protein n=1 Tax=Cupriavidus basilensis TaxID=68895 RepID=UPI0020A67503|nr:hypothetical protein [Cupriavidus basilensis]MCP3017468.1 hypothetical protein [Cupriavidus basilensis]
MNNNQPVRRRYFIVEGAEGEGVKADALAMANAHRLRRLKVEKDYGADGLMLGRDSQPYALLFLEGRPAPEGTKETGRHTEKGECYVEYRPMKNRKAGKQLAADLLAVGGFNGSDFILRRFDAGAHIPSGRSLAVSTAGIVDGVVVVQVPESAAEPFTPPACFREIKKSEYVALTEE